MWPTFPTAYRFSMKMESHISLSSPRAVRVAVCISWQGNTNKSKCVQMPKRVHVPKSVEALTFYVILYLKGGMCINTVVINRVLLFPGGDEAANMPPHDHLPHH